MLSNEEDTEWDVYITVEQIVHTSSSTEEVTVSSENSEPAYNRDLLIQAAEKLDMKGIEYYEKQEYPLAVTAFGEACRKYEDIYGKLSDECADVYYKYGSALLTLQLSGGVAPLVTPVENFHDIEKIDAAQDRDDEVIDVGENETMNPGDTSKEISNNYKIAREMFQMCRTIFTRQNNASRLADTFFKLGEISLDSNHFGKAIEDIGNCLAIQEKIFPPGSTHIAQTLILLGDAFSLSCQYHKAVRKYTTAGVILEKCVYKLVKNENINSVSPDSIEDEIYYVKDLLCKVKDKINEIEDFIRQEMVNVAANNNHSTGSSCVTTGTADLQGQTDVYRAKNSVLKRKKLPSRGSGSQVKKPHLDV